MWAVVGAQCRSGRGVQEIENCSPPPRQRVMNPPLQLEADEKVEEKEEQSRKQCRRVLGKGEEALTCPLCAQ